MMEELVIGYKELEFYPHFPDEDLPTKADCAGYIYMSMVQLCNLAEEKGQGRSSACNAFGGDNGDIPVIASRQAYWWYGEGHRKKKFVLITAVEQYFREVGIEWY
jgi:hypothetical protein